MNGMWLMCLETPAVKEAVQIQTLGFEVVGAACHETVARGDVDGLRKRVMLTGRDASIEKIMPQLQARQDCCREKHNGVVRPKL